MSLKTKTCKICGKEFTPRAANGTMCSAECRRLNHNQTSAARMRQRRVEQKARIEVGEKQPPVKKKKPKERWIKKIYKPRMCERCGKEFHPQNSSQKFCSEKCRNPKLAKEVEQAKRMSALAEIEAKARELGMHYGEYVAKYGG